MCWVHARKLSMHCHGSMSNLWKNLIMYDMFVCDDSLSPRMLASGTKVLMILHCEGRGHRHSYILLLPLYFQYVLSNVCCHCTQYILYIYSIFLHLYLTTMTMKIILMYWYMTLSLVHDTPFVYHLQFFFKETMLPVWCCQFYLITRHVRDIVVWVGVWNW